MNDEATVQKTGLQLKQLITSLVADGARVASGFHDSAFVVRVMWRHGTRTKCEWTKIFVHFGIEFLEDLASLSPREQNDRNRRLSEYLGKRFAGLERTPTQEEWNVPMSIVRTERD